MNAYQWQSRARIVAYVDMVLSVLTIIFLVITAVLITIGGAVAGSELKKQSTYAGQGHAQYDDKRVDGAVAIIVIVAWVIVAIGGMFVALQIFAAYKLLKSTDQGMDATRAKSHAKFWMIVTIVFLIIVSVSYILQREWGALVVTLLVRGIFIAVAKKWMDELSFASQ